MSLLPKLLQHGDVRVAGVSTMLKKVDPNQQLLLISAVVAQKKCHHEVQFIWQGNLGGSLGKKIGDIFAAIHLNELSKNALLIGELVIKGAGRNPQAVGNLPHGYGSKPLFGKE